MFGLAVLFGLGVWVLITLIAILIGAKIAGVKGAFFGFMLTMGGFIVYWIVEYIYIQHTVTKLCETEGGITVYVTPEEWRKQIGEEEWENLHEDWKNIDSSLHIDFQGRKYYGFTQINERISSYKYQDKQKNSISNLDLIYLDTKTQTPILRQHSFKVGTGLNSFSGLKFWLNNIDDCYVDKWSSKDRFLHTEYSNSQSK